MWLEKISARMKISGWWRKDGFGQKNWAVQWAVLYEKRWKSAMAYMRTFGVCNNLWAFRHVQVVEFFGHKLTIKWSRFFCYCYGRLSLPDSARPLYFSSHRFWFFDSFNVYIFPCLRFFISCVPCPELSPSFRIAVLCLLLGFTELI